MAITLDAVLGNGTGSGTSASFTTLAAVASGATVVVACSWWDNINATITVSVGGQTPTNDHQLNNGSDRAAVLSRNFPSGLASGSTISLTSSAGAGHLVAACSYLGITGVDKSGDVTATTAAAWAGSSLTPAIADSLFVCAAGTDGSLASESNTPNVGNERADMFNATAQQGAVMEDLIVASTAANALSGTWGTTLNLTVQTIATVVYSGTAAAAGPAFSPHRMPLGV